MDIALNILDVAYQHYLKTTLMHYYEHSNFLGKNVCTFFGRKILYSCVLFLFYFFT